MEEFLECLDRVYPGVNFTVVVDENDSDACIIYTDSITISEDEVDVLEITDLALEYLGCSDAKVCHELEENMYLN